MVPRDGRPHRAGATAYASGRGVGMRGDGAAECGLARRGRVGRAVQSGVEGVEAGAPDANENSLSSGSLRRMMHDLLLVPVGFAILQRSVSE